MNIEHTIFQIAYSVYSSWCAYDKNLAISLVRRMFLEKSPKLSRHLARAFYFQDSSINH